MTVIETPRDTSEQAAQVIAARGTDWLNPVDRIILLGQRALRAVGQPGWPIQIHVWLASRVDIARLRQGLERLNRRYPVVTSRIVSDPLRARWEPCPDAKCELYEFNLESSDQAAVLRWAERLMAKPVDLDHCSPISFQLLHLNDGRDVFIVQYDHVLMDANSTGPLLKEIHRLATTDDPGDDAPVEIVDEFSTYIRRFTWWQRMRAAFANLADARRCRRRMPLTIGTPGGATTADPTMILRVIPAEQCDVITRRTQQVLGMASLSVAVLASAFRAILHCTSEPVQPDSLLSTMVGAKLRRLTNSGVCFHNLFGILRPTVTAGALGNRDEALRAVSSSLQNQVVKRVDLGGLQLGKLLRRHSPRIERQARVAVQQLGDLSLRYGFFGSLAALGEKFCGAEMTHAYKTSIGMPPWGIHLWANQSRGELVLSAVYQKPFISEELATQFLDFIVADLTA